MFLFFYGNTVQHETADGSQHNLYYDLYDRLEKAEVFRRNESGGWDKQTWVYQYDALDRRIRKGRLKEDGGLEDETRFVWDGSRLLQEVYANGSYTYVYADQDSYEPLAQIHNYTNARFETYQEINYFHCDQIGIPREMTDRDGRLLWFGDYDGWGRLDGETNITGAHQPFRLQNQYCDAETGLHYNLFRYYDPNCGRFISQDPIGLEGGFNVYQFAPNAQAWIDPLGLWGAFLARAITVVVGAISKVASKVLSKLKCGKCAAAIPRTVSFSGNQLQKKFKHASDFGIRGNYSKANAEAFKQAIEKHIQSSSTSVIQGTYRGEPVVHFLNKSNGLNVITKKSGDFISGWKLNPSQLQNVVSRGAL